VPHEIDYMEDKTMNLNLNYKKILLIHIFIDCVYLGLVLTHDSYHIFLAIASVMLAYGTVCLFINNRGWMLVCFVLFSITTCQLSITIRKTLVDQGFRQQLGVNPTGVLVADMVHGFKRVANCPSEVKSAFTEAGSGNTYVLLERINYRYLTLVLLMPMTAFSLLLRERKEEPVPRKSKK